MGDLASNQRAWEVLRRARLIRYEHGGGRFAVIDDRHEHQQRELVADFYNEDTRELIFKLIQDAIEALSDDSSAAETPVSGGPIATAPIDGTHFLGWSAEYGWRETYCDTYKPGSPGYAQGLTDRWWVWNEEIHNSTHSWKPTHWLPLPSVVETNEHSAKGLASAGSSAAVNPRDTVGGSAETYGQPANQKCINGCGRPRLPGSQHCAECDPAEDRSEFQCDVRIESQGQVYRCTSYQGHPGGCQEWALEPAAVPSEKATTTLLWRHDWEMLSGSIYRCRRCGTQCIDAHDAPLCSARPPSENGKGDV